MIFHHLTEYVFLLAIPSTNTVQLSYIYNHKSFHHLCADIVIESASFPPPATSSMDYGPEQE